MILLKVTKSWLYRCHPQWFTLKIHTKENKNRKKAVPSPLFFQPPQALSINGGFKQVHTHVNTSKPLLRGSAQWQIGYSPVKINDEDKLGQHLASDLSKPCSWDGAFCLWGNSFHWEVFQNHHRGLAREERERHTNTEKERKKEGEI